MASPLLRKNVSARPKTKKLNATRLSGAVAFPDEAASAEVQPAVSETPEVTEPAKTPLKESNHQKPLRQHASLDTSAGLEDLLDKEIEELQSITNRELGSSGAPFTPPPQVSEEKGPGWLGSIPAKLRDFHQFLIEDDIQSPEELVKPIEGVLGQGLDAINFIGRTALAVGNIVDNAIEGGINLVSKTALDVRENVAQSRRGSNSSQEEGMQSMEAPEPTRGRLPRLGKGRAPRSQSLERPSRMKESVGVAPLKLEKKLTHKLPTPIFDGSAGKEPSLKELTVNTKKVKEAVAKTDTVTKERSRSCEQQSSSTSFAEAVPLPLSPKAELREKETESLKLEETLDLLQKEMLNSKVECTSLRKVVDALQVDLRKTQRQCQDLRRKNSQLSRETRSVSGSSKAPAPPETEDPMHDMVRQQMEYLLREKAKLAAENNRLCRENANLQELLDLEFSSSDPYFEGGYQGFGTPPPPPPPFEQPFASTSTPSRLAPEASEAPLAALSNMPQWSPPPPPPGTEDDLASPDTPLQCPLPAVQTTSPCAAGAPQPDATAPASPSAATAALKLTNMSSPSNSPTLQMQATNMTGGSSNQSRVSLQVYNPTNGQCMANMDVQFRSE